MKKTIGEVFSYLYMVFMFFVTIYWIFEGNQFKVSVGAAGILCGLAPLLFQIIWKNKIENSIYISYILFCFGSQFLGSIMKWYSLGYWDMLMHFIAGILLGFIGIRVLEAYTSSNLLVQLSSGHVFWFVKGFGVFFGVLWEVYEFTGDQFFGTTMQGGGNFDTMTDLLCDVFGSLIVAYWYKKKHEKMISAVIKEG